MKLSYFFICTLFASTFFAHDNHVHYEPNTHPATGDANFDLAVVYINKGDAKALKALLSEHPELVTQRASGNEEYTHGYFTNPTLLHFTAFNPWWNEETTVPASTPEVVEVLLDAGADVNATSGEAGNQWTTLGLVTSGSKTREAGVEDEMIEILVEHGANPNDGVNGAVLYTDWAAMDKLIALGAAKTPVVLAYQNDTEGLKKALANADSDTKQKALFTAVVKGNTAATQVALDAGADPNAYMPTPYHSTATAMHQAAWANQPEILEVLVENGGRTDIKDKTYGGTPLGWALHGHKDEAIAVLFPKTDIDPTVQQLAAWGMNEQLEAYLKEHPDDVNAVDDWGTALQQAAFHGRIETVKLLIANNADVNQTEGGDKVPGGGITALDKAVSTDMWGSGATLDDRAACAEILRKHGAKTSDELEKE